ncbi:acyl carrier protein [Wenxinia saemankumensis]|uniref:Acyl carrier protein n=1 Tax=Wenxinia saemankumensis TaxID=1447782 RepID=A0A1M6HCZ5_9RHOB|nr:acyl carrier protein [Wenxinia saemankumensis]SHJ20087.1 acyl carrier protein [Wenxinia saemankumensis]
MTAPMPDVRHEVKRILAEQALIEPTDVSDDATLESLGVDSMGLVEAIFGLEEAFDIRIPFNANAPGESGFDISSVDSMVATVERLIAEQKG